MVFRGQPEHRHRAGLLRQHHGGERLEYAEYRASEQTHLLSGNHHRCAVLQPLNIVQSFLACAELTVLPFQDSSHGLAAVVGINDLFALVLPPVRRQRRARIKTADFVKMMKEIFKKAGGMGNARKWKTLGIQSYALHYLHKII